MFYVDTSVLVSALTNERASAVSKAFLVSTDPEELCLSPWVITEFSSALALKLWTGQIDRMARTTVLAGFTRLVTDSFTEFPITAQHFDAAARFCDQDQLGIRAGDALHLAIAMAHGAHLVTLDRRLFEAGLAVGAAVRDLQDA